MSAVADGVGAVVDNIGDAVGSGLRFGQQALTSLADFSLKGARQGLKLTKTVLKQIPMDKLRASGANLNVMKKVNLRKLFQSRYGAEVRSTGLADEADLDVFMDDEAGEEALTDEKVQERVDKKYFDREYDPVRFELSQLQASWADLSEHVVDAEKKAIEDAILDRRQKCNVVGTTLKRRVLDNHSVFVSGIEQIQKVNEDLLATSTVCTHTRETIHLAKRSFVVGGLIIPVLQRRRVHLNGLQQVTEAMNTAVQRYQTLQQLMQECRFVEAVKMLREQADDDNVEQLKKLDAMRPILAEWSRFASGTCSILQQINASVSELLSGPRQFNELKYRNAIEACKMLGDASDCFNNVAQSLWGNAIQIMIRSLSEMSSVKDEQSDIGRIAAGIDAAHLLLAVVQLCGKMADFLVLYNAVCKAHLEEIKLATSALKGELADGTEKASAQASLAFHTGALEYVKPVGRRIGRDIGEKLSVILSCAQFAHVDLDKVLHMFFTVSMLVEGTSVLNLNKDELASIRSTVKTSLNDYMVHHFLSKRCDNLIAFMAEDTWAANGATVLSQQIVKPLTPDAYRNSIRLIKAYTNADTAISSTKLADNPFYSQPFMVPQDTTALIQMEPLSALTERDPANWHVATHSSAVCSSSQFTANMLVELIARVVVRFPPLAAEVLQWCEDIVSLYVLVVADNFVSCSREVLMEEQPHFTFEGRRTLERLRGAARRCAPEAVARRDSLGVSDFPPRVCGQVEELQNPQKMYGLVQRCVAVETTLTVVVALRAAIQTVAALLPEGVVKERQANASSLHRLGDELVQVIMHRMVLANFPTSRFSSDLARMYNGSVKVNANEPSPCMQGLLQTMRDFLDKRPSFPSRWLEDMFLCRFVFAVQSITVQEYALLVMPKQEFQFQKKKMDDMFVLQLNADVSSFNDKVQDMTPIGAKAIALRSYVKEFLNSAFEEDFEKRQQWVAQHHAPYPGVDVANWLCMGSRTKRKALEEVLARLKHVDGIPLITLKE